MTQITTQFNGIQRNVPGNVVPDGACNEMINLRHKDGVLRPIGDKLFLDSIPAGFGNIITHWVGNVRYFVAYDTLSGNVVVWVDNSKFTTSVGYIGVGKDITIKAIGNTLIIVNRTDNKLQYIRNNNGQYTFLELPRLPVLAFHNIKLNVRNFIGSLDLSGLSNLEKQLTVKAYLDKKRNEMESDYSFEGYVMITYCFELMDSSYILPSCPQLIYIGNNDYISSDLPINEGPTDYTAGYPCYRMYNPENTPFPDFLKYKDIIKGIAIFMTYPENYHRAPKFEEVTSDVTAKKRYINEDAKLTDITKKNLFFKVYTIPVDKINSLINSPTVLRLFSNYSTVRRIGPDSFDWIPECNLSDLKTSDTLSVDGFSHHKIVGNAAFIYNDRLNLANIKTKLYSGPTPREFFGVNAVEGAMYVMEWELNTQEGIRIVRSQTFNKNSNNAPWPNLISYPDRRATKFRLLYNLGVWATIYEYTLIPHEIHNFAYALVNFKNGASIVGSILTLPANPPILQNYNVVNDILIDKNRVQISEVANPFLFPAKNSYQIGNAEILDITSNSDPISQGQFGQYPLLVFCKDGIWAMQLSTGESYITNIVPFSGEILARTGAYFNTGSFIIFIDSDYNIKILSGQAAQKFSDPIILPKQYNLIGLDNFLSATNHDQTCNVGLSLDQVSGLEYIKGANLCFNKDEREIIVSNPSFPNYSFIYNLDSKSWYKSQYSFKAFINDYSNVLGLSPALNNECKLYRLNDEVISNNIEIYIETMPIKFGSDILKKIKRIKLACEINSSNGKYISFLLYGSLDGHTYLYLTGKQATGKIDNLILQNSQVSCKYYKIIISGTILSYSSIAALVADIDVKFANKLR